MVQRHVPPGSHMLSQRQENQSEQILLQSFATHMHCAFKALLFLFDLSVDHPLNHARHCWWAHAWSSWALSKFLEWIYIQATNKTATQVVGDWGKYCTWQLSRRIPCASEPQQFVSSEHQTSVFCVCVCVCPYVSVFISRPVPWNPHCTISVNTQHILRSWQRHTCKPGIGEGVSHQAKQKHTKEIQRVRSLENC